jgi:adenylate kinase family enzyme
MKTCYIDYEDIVRILRKKKRINIIGPPGSGKTTLSKKISNDLQIKLIKLDNILFDRDCKLIKSKHQVLLRAIELESTCVLDGTYHSLFSEDRIVLIDHFIMIKINFFKAFFRIVKRTIKNNDLDCGEKFTFSLIKFLFTYYLCKRNSLKKIIPKNKLLIYKI